MLEAFRIIPLNAKNEKLTALEEAQQDDILEFEQTFSNKTQLSSKKVQHRSFRNEYIAYTFATISLAVSVALLNTENVNHIGRVVVITDQMATVNIQSLRTINLIQELKWNDHMTWGSEAVIRDNIVEEVESAAKIYQYVLYGNKDRDNESPPANTYLEPEDLDDNFTSCLAANTTFCETRTYNATIGYTKDILEHGVLRLQDRLMTLFNRFSVAASVGPVVLDEASVKFMDMVVEPDLLDGWQERQEDQSHNLDHFLEEATHVNHWIMAAEVLTIVVGQFVVFTRMINYFLFLDRCNVELLVRLPRDIRKLPEFARFLSECLSRNQQVGTITTFLVRIGLKKPPNRGREDDTDILKELRRKSVGKEAGAEERESTDARIHKLGDQGGGGDAGGGGGGAKRTSLFASMFKRGDMDSGGDDSGGNGSQSMLDNYAIDNRIDQWESAHGAEVDNPFESPVRASTDRRSARKGHDTDDDDDDDYASTAAVAWTVRTATARRLSKPRSVRASRRAPPARPAHATAPTNDRAAARSGPATRARSCRVSWAL
ncbi:hypothetical protein BC831DRAFT_224150 [Entophlyctis helioformis]|nr:hypothetical protein BC831DRAFT_224150 [Entophlyctis helioformis]